MRVLLLVHDFLPAHPSGTEVYTGAMARELAARGHDVRVFATEKDVARRHMALERREWEGLVVHELVNNLYYRDFRETWDYPPAEAAFVRVLDDFRPDVVHVMHLLYLSVGCAEEAHRRGIPVFYTLHDFWLQCARFGQRIHADGQRCDVIDFARCGTCLARFEYAQTAFARRTGRALALLRRTTGLDLGGAARAARRALHARRTERDPTAPVVAPGDAARFAFLARERDAELRARLVPVVERFFAPSRFLRERFLEWGLPAESLEELGYGLELAPFRAVTRAPRAAGDPLRVAFVGTLAPHKGAHVLLAAWARLAPELRARGTLTVHGPTHHFPAYVAELERAAAGCGARLAGALARAAVPGVLAASDVLVVPSVWYENSPFTIHEARAARTPLLVSDLGGMAELVRDGREGWRFRTGDADDLAAQLARLLANPATLDTLDFSAPQKDAAESARELEERYAAALALRRPA